VPPQEPVVIEHGESPAEEAVMTVVEHLSELRRRIFISVVAIAIGSVVGYLVTPDVIRNLKDLGGIARPLIFTSPGGALFLQLKLALMIGIALSSPIVLYELWSFVSPGLTPSERRGIRPWVPLSLLFLALGIGVAYVTLPLATGFLLGFAIAGVVEPLITTDAYFGFVTTMFLVFGLVMQFPFVILLLSKVGVFSADQLRHNRRYVFIGIAIFAVVITPGGDPFSPTIMTLVMYPLYELTIRLVSRSSAPSRVATAASAPVK
jgi:sec-independent protein translocase protein TatC